MNIKLLFRYLIEVGGFNNAGATWAELVSDPQFPDFNHIEDLESRAKAARQSWSKFRKYQTYEKAREYVLKEVKTDKDGNEISKRFVRMPAQTQRPDGLELYGVSEDVKGGGGWNIWRKAKPGEISRDDFRAVALEALQSPIEKKADWKPAEKSVGHIQVTAIADVHIGMANNKEAVFPGLEWTPEELDKRTDTMLAHLDPTASKLYLVFGGDIMDGLDGMTARRGHKMPQNLDNRGQLRTASGWALKILDTATQVSQAPIEVIWLCESNHAPDLDFAVGLTLEMVAEQRWGGQVKIVMQEAFVASYSIAGRSFLFTHGYDSHLMKNGWPRYLQPQHQQFVERVIEYNRCTLPVLVRFDRHQYHDVGHPRFRDILCPAFSSPSGWLQLNFAADSRGGFVKIQIEQDGRISPVLVEF